MSGRQKRNARLIALTLGRFTCIPRNPKPVSFVSLPPFEPEKPALAATVVYARCTHVFGSFLLMTLLVSSLGG